jgi:hypothetical protein
VFADPIHLRPFENDLLIARACAQIATPTIERSLKVLTSLADERAMLVIAAAVWLASRYCKRSEDREEADIMLASVLIAGAMPDLFKLLVRRRRPHNQRTQKRHSLFRRCVGFFPLRTCYSPRCNGTIGCSTCSHIAPASCNASFQARP